MSIRICPSSIDTPINQGRIKANLAQMAVEVNADLVAIAWESRQQELIKGLLDLEELIGSSGEQLHLS